MRVTIDKDPYIYLDEDKDWIRRGIWPCKWICRKNAGESPFVTAYRKRFSMDKDETMRVHVSADERYELFLDGKCIGRGSERGDQANWYYETYDIPLTKGDHVFVARVWSVGARAPYAQMTVYPGFIFSPEGEFIEKLGTGIAEWEAKKLGGYEFVDTPMAGSTGANLIMHGDECSWGYETGGGDGWEPVVSRDFGANGFIRNEYPFIHLMKPATLPAMVDNEISTGSVRFVSDKTDSPVNSADCLNSELNSWDLIKGKGKVTIPSNTIRRVIIDLENYYCAYPEIITTGGKGSSIRVYWAEALYENPSPNAFSPKGNRNEIEGKTFLGIGDTFLPNGGSSRKFTTLWWQAGRYVELLIQTTSEPLTIESFKLHETRYPLVMESKFESNDPRLASVIPIALRGLQMCSHETYMDCPYYEQLQYVGDTRLECLTTYAMTHDDRLPRKALSMFDASRLHNGLTASRYPSFFTQIIPPFSLWWVGMVYDYSLWRNDEAFVKSMMPGVRGVLDYYLSLINKDGLLDAPNGWNFMDWVPDWGWGNPPDADKGVSGVINWHAVLVLSLAAELEESLGEYLMSEKWECAANNLAVDAFEHFWDEKRGLLADDLAHEHFSEHTQCMALLSGFIDEYVSDADRERMINGLLTDPNIERTTISFTHYLFETYRKLGKIDKFFERMGLWFELEKIGFKTTLEMPEPSRSDCHGWAAHPIYHYYATVLGIRPASRGFKTVQIEPQLGPLTSAKGTLVHPKGEITVDFRIENDALKGTVSLPDGVTGTLKYGRIAIELVPGMQEI